MKKKTLRRVLLAILLAAIAGAAAGYYAAPGQPVIFAHMPPGSYLSEYRSMAECQEARQAFAAGRGFPVRDTDMLITPDFSDFCLGVVKNFGSAER